MEAAEQTVQVSRCLRRMMLDLPCEMLISNCVTTCSLAASTPKASSRNRKSHVACHASPVTRLSPHPSLKRSGAAVSSKEL
jgi:hypothetical protein